MGRVSVLVGGVLAVGALVSAGWWLAAPDEAVWETGAGIDRPGGGVRRMDLPDPVVVPRPTPDPVMPLLRPDPPPAIREPPWWSHVTLADVDRLVDDLRDDDVSGNATEASSELASLLRSPRLGEGTRRRLESALESYDVQQRYFAARVLQQGVRLGVVDPSPQMIGVTVDIMCGGRLRGSPEMIRELRENAFRPVTAAMRFLIDHVDAAEVELLDVLGREFDEESGFLASFVLAMGGKSEHVDRIAPRLIGRFADNDIGHDRAMALNAILRLGNRAEWWLQVSVGGDPQQEDTRRLALAKLRNEGEAPGGAVARRNRPTRSSGDPVSSWSFEVYHRPGW